MNIPKPYFKNVPNYGDLDMEQIIVEYLYPLLSVLKDHQNNRYVCMCFDTRGSQQWLIAPISTDNLVKLLNDKITLDYPFKKCKSKVIFAERNYETKLETFKLFSPESIPQEYLPEENEYLESEDDEWEEYINEIKSNEKLIKDNNILKESISIHIKKDLVRFTISDSDLSHWINCDNYKERTLLYKTKKQVECLCFA